MIKILIVDDNKNNRMILKLLLEDYMDENKNINFEIFEAEDGLDALQKSREEQFDIVLMDIMMPNMDGIEATKIIRQENDKIMIIAVSAVDDSDRKTMILNNGAEDYISKPINSDIFLSRLENYITIHESRKNKNILSPKSTNLFTQKIFSRHIRFIINSEDALLEFWEYFLLTNNEKCKNLSDVVRTIFEIVDTQRKLKIDSDIFVEESVDKKYFTLTKLDKVPIKTIDLIIKKNNFIGSYKLDKEKISFELNIVSSVVKDTTEDVIQEKTNLKNFDEADVEEIASQIDFNKSTELEVFDYIDGDDLYDLEEYAGKLNSIMLVIGSGDVTEDDVIDIYTYLDKLGSILATYGEVYSISQALSGLSVDMSSHMQEFIDNSEALGPMCKGFSNDMSSWIEKSFHTGAPSADFMNDTIIVNCKTIGGMLKMDEVSEDIGDDFDDIFDF